MRSTIQPAWLCLLCLLSCLVLTPPTLAGESDPPADWRSAGPFVGDVRALAVVPAVPGRLLAGTVPERSTSFAGSPYGGLYVSDDDGLTWRRHSQSTLSSVYDIEVLPDGRTVWLSDYSRLWHSDDGGDTLSSISSASFRQVFDIALDPLDPSAIWLAGSSSPQGAELMFSDDGGTTFVDRSPPGDWPCLAAAAEGAKVAVVCRRQKPHPSPSKLWLSTDHGQTWTDRTAGLPESRLQVVRRLGNTLFVGIDSTFDGGLYASTDDGLTWNALHNDPWPQTAVRTMLPSAAGSRLLVGTDGGGLYESTDGGASWSFGVGASEGWSVRAVALVGGTEPRTLLGLRDLALARRVGTGDFAVSHTGISNLTVHDIAVYGPNPNVIALATDLTFTDRRGGIYTSSDGGAHWQREEAPGGAYVAAAYTADGTLFALAQGPSSPSGVWRRGPDGIWTAAGPTDTVDWESLAVGADGNHLWIGGSALSPEGRRAVLHRSTDGGGTWSRVFEGEPGSEAIDTIVALDDQTLLAVLNDRGALPQLDRVLRSTDAGASWQPAVAGLPPELTIRGLCASSGSPFEPYLLTSGEESAVFRSSDHGTAWWSAGPPADFTSFACDPDVSQVLYATRFTTTARGVALSADGGATFSALAEGEHLPNRAGFDLEIRPIPGPEQEHELLLGALGIGLWSLRLPNRVLFSDGFESGDLGRWSLAQP